MIEIYLFSSCLLRLSCFLSFFLIYFIIVSPVIDVPAYNRSASNRGCCLSSKRTAFFSSFVNIFESFVIPISLSYQQRLINNTRPDNKTLVYRTPVFRGEIPALAEVIRDPKNDSRTWQCKYLSIYPSIHPFIYRPDSHHWTNLSYVYLLILSGGLFCIPPKSTNNFLLSFISIYLSIYLSRTLVLMRRADEVFTPDEIAKIGRMVDILGVDYSECDILRDINDGRIYVLDVNKTPNSTWYYKTFPHAGHILIESLFRVPHILYVYRSLLVYLIYLPTYFIYSIQTHSFIHS